jgi:hypothetical protein
MEFRVFSTRLSSLCVIMWPTSDTSGEMETNSDDMGQEHRTGCRIVARRVSETTARLSHSIIVRAPGLLPMLYKPSELARDLGIPVSTLRDWVQGGVPHQRDGRGHIWINGVEFAQWVEIQRGLRRGPTLGKDEAYCFCCRQAVKLVEPTSVVDGKRILLQASCPQCGSRINKGVPHHGESE